MLALCMRAVGACACVCVCVRASVCVCVSVRSNPFVTLSAAPGESACQQHTSGRNACRDTSWLLDPQHVLCGGGLECLLGCTVAPGLQRLSVLLFYLV